MAEGAEVWRCVARPGRACGPVPVAAAARFAELIGPALAAALLPPGAIAGDRARHALLLGRFARARQIECLEAVSEAGVPAVCLKGFANAHRLYDEPAARIVGDLDILIRPADLPRLTAALACRGYAFRGRPARRWGFISEASFLPFVSADGACNLDIHVAPDCYPLYLGLDTDALFAAARPFAADGRAALAPCDEHALLLCASNAAKDKFGPFAARKIVDALRLLALRPDLDWDEIGRRLRAARLALPGQAFLALLCALGAEETPIPPALRRPPGGLRRGEYRRALADTLALYPDEPGLPAVLRREWLLGAEPAVALRNGAMRLAGLVRPRSGLPTG